MKGSELVRSSLVALALSVSGCGAAVKETRPMVVIEEGALVIYDENASDETQLQIHFELDSDVIGEESHHTLEVLAEFIQSHSHIAMVEVQGHTDEQGSPAYNVGLSRRRAESVIAFLTAEGVDPARLRARGFGDRRRIARGNTPEARARNRRVEFVIAASP